MVATPNLKCGKDFAGHQWAWGSPYTTRDGYKVPTYLVCKRCELERYLIGEIKMRKSDV